MTHTTNIPYFFWESIDSNTSLQATFCHQNDKTLEYELEAIVDCIKKQYLTKWKGYPEFKNI